MYIHNNKTGKVISPWGSVNDEVWQVGLQCQNRRFVALMGEESTLRSASVANSIEVRDFIKADERIYNVDNMVKNFNTGSLLNVNIAFPLGETGVICDHRPVSLEKANAFLSLRRLNACYLGNQLAASNADDIAVWEPAGEFLSHSAYGDKHISLPGGPKDRAFPNFPSHSEFVNSFCRSAGGWSHLFNVVGKFTLPVINSQAKRVFRYASMKWQSDVRPSEFSIGLLNSSIDNLVKNNLDEVCELTVMNELSRFFIKGYQIFVLPADSDGVCSVVTYPCRHDEERIFFSDSLVLRTDFRGGNDNPDSSNCWFLPSAASDVIAARPSFVIDDVSYTAFSRIKQYGFKFTEMSHPSGRAVGVPAPNGSYTVSWTVPDEMKPSKLLFIDRDDNGLLAERVVLSDAFLVEQYLSHPWVLLGSSITNNSVGDGGYAQFIADIADNYGGVWEEDAKFDASHETLRCSHTQGSCSSCGLQNTVTMGPVKATGEGGYKMSSLHFLLPNHIKSLPLCFTLSEDTLPGKKASWANYLGAVPVCQPTFVVKGTIFGDYLDAVEKHASGEVKPGRLAELRKIAKKQEAELYSVTPIGVALKNLVRTTVIEEIVGDISIPKEGGGSFKLFNKAGKNAAKFNIDCLVASTVGANDFDQFKKNASFDLDDVIEIQSAGDHVSAKLADGSFAAVESETDLFCALSHPSCSVKTRGVISSLLKQSGREYSTSISAEMKHPYAMEGSEWYAMSPSAFLSRDGEHLNFSGFAFRYKGDYEDSLARLSVGTCVAIGESAPILCAMLFPS